MEVFQSAFCYYLEQSYKFLLTNVQFLYSICIWKYIAKIRYEESAFDHLPLFLAYDIFLREYKLKAQYHYILKVFDGNLKNVCQKAIKNNSWSFRSTSNVPMFHYHVIKMNKV